MNAVSKVFLPRPTLGEKAGLFHETDYEALGIKVRDDEKVKRLFTMYVRQY